MGPIKTPKNANRNHGEASSSKAPQQQQQRKKHGDSAGAGAKRHRMKPTDDITPALPGVQKIKAALRQTRRLLAKDKLAADVRVATERKQRALEADLVAAERARKERTLAQKYHMIKFFERQKVSRKLKQVRQHLESCTDKKEKKKLEKALFELRVDLNYILHYPKLKKYISLFPPELREHADGDDATLSPKGKSKATAVVEGEQDAKAATDLEREELRKQIRERMERGELSMEPEKEEHRQHSKIPRSNATSESAPATKEIGAKRKHVPDIGEDAFFGEDSAGEDEDAAMDSG